MMNALSCENAARQQNSSFGTDLPPPYFMLQETQGLSQLGINQPPVITNDQNAFLPELTNQREMLAEEAACSTPIQISTISTVAEGTADYEMMTLVTYMISTSLLKPRSVILNCQFCKHRVTTKVQISKMHEVLTDKQIERYRKQTTTSDDCSNSCCWCCLCLICPCVACCLLSGKENDFEKLMNSPVTYHKCPNCNNYIGLYHAEVQTYCTVQNTPKKQMSELTQKLLQKLNGNTKDRIHQRR